MLDHVVLATPDLAATVETVAERTGVRPAPGGSHVGWGTANHLVAFRGTTSYLEIVGPDPSGPVPGLPRPFGIDALTEACVRTWAVRPQDLDATIAQARARGSDPGDATAMSRRTSDGELLEWRLTPTDTRHDGLVPFLIDWGTTPHPTTRDLPAVELVSLRMGHPDPAAIARRYAALGLDHVEVRPAQRPSIELVLGTPLGLVTF